MHPKYYYELQKSFQFHHHRQPKYTLRICMHLLYRWLHRHQLYMHSIHFQDYQLDYHIHLQLQLDMLCHQCVVWIHLV